MVSSRSAIDMPDWNAVHPLRSDGVLAISGGPGPTQKNRPNDDQLKKVKDGSGITRCYTKIGHDDVKHGEWRKKLGGMFAREIAEEEEKDNIYVLSDLPQNYTLWEMQQWSDSKATEGPADRHDTYLYGHPGGPKKRYRSPREFFPHLLWLMTDTMADPWNCRCKFCSHSSGDVVEPHPKKAKTGPSPGNSNKEPEDKKKPGEAKKPAQASNSSTTTAITTTPTPALAVSKVKSGSNPDVTAKISSRAVPPPAVTSAPKALTPVSQTPMPMPTQPIDPLSREQGLDSKYDMFLYRPGELVWFNRGVTWGLAVIAHREFITNPNPQQPNERKRYFLQPLSHPFHPHPDTVSITQEDLLRPWLAWSAPDPCHAPLKAAGLTYDAIDWASVRSGNMGPGDAEVDGSIFAARMIDESYTLFGKLSQPSSGPGETHWNGIYLGGEKIWLGEPIRLRIGGGRDIMILHDIVEKTRPGFQNTGSVSTVSLIGDIYSLSTIVYNQNLGPLDNPQLPQRLQRDLQFRNASTIPNRGAISFWNFMKPLARLGLEDIKGRWYESSLLLPILRGPEDFAKDVQRGDIIDAGACMNGRLETSVDKVGRRRATRREALGRAVPQNFSISEVQEVQRPRLTSSRTSSTSRPGNVAYPRVELVHKDARGMPFSSTDEDHLMAQYMSHEGQFFKEAMEE